MIAAGNGGSLFIIDGATATLKKTVASGDKPLEAVSVTDDATKAVVVSEKRKLRLFDANGAKPIGKEITLEQDAVSLAFANKNELVIVGQANNSMAVYAVSAFTAEAKDPVKPVRVMNGHAKPVLLLKAFGDGQPGVHPVDIHVVAQPGPGQPLGKVRERRIDGLAPHGRGARR